MKTPQARAIVLTAMLGLVSLTTTAGPLPKEGGSYDATILESAKCPDLRSTGISCWHLAVQLQSGAKLPDVRLFQFARIADRSGVVSYKYPYLSADGTITRDVADDSKEAKQIRESFYAAAAKLKKGSRVRLEQVSCEMPDAPPDSSQCEAMGVREL